MEGTIYVTRWNGDRYVAEPWDYDTYRTYLTARGMFLTAGL